MAPANLGCKTPLGHFAHVPQVPPREPVCTAGQLGQLHVRQLLGVLLEDEEAAAVVRQACSRQVSGSHDDRDYTSCIPV